MAKSKKGRTSRKSKRKSEVNPKGIQKDPAGKCPPGYIERAGFMRSSYNRKGGIHVKGTRVGTACTPHRGKRRGKPGKTPVSKAWSKKITTKPKYSLRKYGYSTKKNAQSRQAAIEKALKIENPLSVMRHLILRANLQAQDPLGREPQRIMRQDIDWLKGVYSRWKERHGPVHIHRAKSRKSKTKKSKTKKSKK